MKSPRYCTADPSPHLPLQICQSRQKSNEKEKPGKNEESAKNEQIGQNRTAAWPDSHGLDLGNLGNILASYLASVCVRTTFAYIACLDLGNILASYVFCLCGRTTSAHTIVFW